MSENILISEMAALKAELQALREKVHHLENEPKMPANATTLEHTSRRRMLKRLGIGAAAAGLAVTGMAATSNLAASAATGSNLILGHNTTTANANTASSATEIVYGGSKMGTAFLVHSVDGFNPTSAVYPASIGGWTNGSSDIKHGIYGASTAPNGIGVVGAGNGSSGIGVKGEAVDGLGIGVVGEGPNIGVFAKSNSVGVRGEGGTTGVQGKGSSFGLYGEGATGVFALSNTNTTIPSRGVSSSTALVAINDNPTTTASQDDAIRATTRNGRALVATSGNAPQIRIVPDTADANATLPARSGLAGDLYVDKLGILWFNTGGPLQNGWKKLAGAQTAGQLHVLPSPERLIDTRFDLVGANDPKGQVSGFAPADKPTAANTYTYTITERSGANGSKVPQGAAAIVGNVTVVVDENAPGGGFMTMWPAGGAIPTTSTLNYKPGQVAFNNFTLGLSTDGKLSVAAFRNLHIIIDVVGYYL